MAVNGYSAAKEILPRIHLISGTIFLLCFAFIFPVTLSYEVLNNEQKSSFAPRCFTDIPSGAFVIQCEDVNVNDLTAMIEEEIKNSPIGKPRISSLRILNLHVESGKLSQNWINTTSFDINELQIFSAKIDRIENKAFMGYAFKNLQKLVLQGTSNYSLLNN
ncbi:uncharacterized protein LOC143911315 [Arctopsyche grandis]|uniref:uncharacterized protein LOC143911315 n=1 Tax=Arctopsyche grandis TaxID=121162 RepID=UPI00406DA413